MKVREAVCDVTGCSKRGAREFAFFTGRQTDGAGSMEDWHEYFDLCDEHQRKLFDVMLAAMTTNDARALMARFGVTTREG